MGEGVRERKEEEKGKEEKIGKWRRDVWQIMFPSLHSFQLKGYGVSVIEGVDPNADNFVSAGIINTRSTLIGCLLRLEPNKETKVSHTYKCADNNNA